MLTKPRLLSLLHRLHRDEQGAVVVEFAFWIVGFFFVAMIAIDFGFYFVQRTKLNMAVGSVAVAAFNTPTLVIHGDDDQVVPLEITGKLAAGSSSED